MANVRVWLIADAPARDSAQAAINAAGLGAEVQFFNQPADAPLVYFEGLSADELVVQQIEAVLDGVAGTRHWRGWRRPAEMASCVQEAEIYTTYATPAEDWPDLGDPPAGPGPLQKLTDRAAKAASYRDFGHGPLAPLRQAEAAAPARAPSKAKK